MRPLPGWSALVKRLMSLRVRVPAGARRHPWPASEDLPRGSRRRRPGNPGDDDGGAAVREPRRPSGPRPRSDAGASPIPAPPQQVRLPAEPEPR